MARRLTLIPLATALVMAAAAAQADELPTRKAGLWEIRMAQQGAPLADMTIQHCTDETTDRKMTSSVQPMTQQSCAKQETRKTATGYVIDAVCEVAGMTTTSRSEITGDFNSAYTVKVTSHSDRPIPGLPKNASMTLEAKWVGACKDGQRPGDIVMPGGVKMNITDIDRLKALIPGAK